MSILTIDQAFSSIDKKFRDKIILSYKEIKSRYSKAIYNAEYDASGLSSGKFCESILRFLQHTLIGTFIPFGTHIKNFNDECLKLINLPAANANESLRIIIPRAILFLYTLRGKRGIGHIGGDVEANKIDAETIVRVSDWTVCEFIRVFHNLSLEEAQAIVDSISLKTLPEIWEIAGKKRILISGLDFKQKTLLLLYQSSDNFEFVEDLYSWTEYSSLSMYKSAVIKPLHTKKLVEYDTDTELVYLSPLGVSEVEKNIISRSVK
ncbi:MAG: hypothetical protein QM802_09240 [Agriterribacter sp.]